MSYVETFTGDFQWRCQHNKSTADQSCEIWEKVGIKPGSTLATYRDNEHQQYDYKGGFVYYLLSVWYTHKLVMFVKMCLNESLGRQTFI